MPEIGSLSISELEALALVLGKSREDLEWRKRLYLNPESYQRYLVRKLKYETKQYGNHSET